MKATKVFVTGSEGFVGRPLCQYLLERGFKLVGEDRGEDATKVDVADINQLQNVEDEVEALIHLAAKTSVKDSLNNPYETYYTNLLGTMNVLEFKVEIY